MKAITWSFFVVFCLVGCATVGTATSGSRSVLFLSVDPPDAEVYIDGSYQGRIDGWVHNRIPVEAGLRRVELRRSGYTSERFDISVASTEEVSISLSMVPELDVLSEEEKQHNALVPRERIR